MNTIVCVCMFMCTIHLCDHKIQMKISGWINEKSIFNKYDKKRY